MPAHRKPTKVLELSGAFAHNPDRAREPEPEPAGPLGAPPVALAAGELAAWAEIADVAAGWLTNADRLAVELASVLMAKFRDRNISPPELSNLRAALGCLGLNPSDRSRISVVKDKPKNQFAALAEEARGFIRPN